MKQIPLTQDKFTQVDDDIYEWAKDYKWYARKHRRTYYAVRNFRLERNGQQRTMFLHHCIIGFPLDKNEIDHIDGSGLNNQRSNLRIATNRGNEQNKHLTNKSSKYIGVSLRTDRDKWEAKLYIKGKTLHLGLFDVEEDAALAYKAACEKLVN